MISGQGLLFLLGHWLDSASVQMVILTWCRTFPPPLWPGLCFLLHEPQLKACVPITCVAAIRSVRPSQDVNMMMMMMMMMMVMMMMMMMMMVVVVMMIVIMIMMMIARRITWVR
jgi:hypothetical protein